MPTIVSLFGDRATPFPELNARATEYAATRGLTYEWAPQQPYDREDVISRLSRADAGIIDVEHYGDEVFARLGSRPRVLVRFGAGYDNVDLDAARRHGIVIARTPGANATGVAEMALALMLTARRRFTENVRAVRDGTWSRHVSHETVGATVGIVGFGAVGRVLARLLRGFECRVLVYDPYAGDADIRAAQVERAGLDELVAAADAISLHVPYGTDTHHLIDKRRLALMKPTAVLVNTSRGGVVDEDALHAALVAGTIGGAGLDVFSTEPLPPDHPLIGLPNVVLTPHASSQTEQSLWRIYRMAIDVAADILSGQGSPHVLNPTPAGALR